MFVREKKAPPSRKQRGGQPTQKPPAEPIRIPAPLRGLVLNESLANPQPGGAVVLDNYICGLADIEPRKGWTKYATVGTTAVQSLFTYKSGSTEKFFAGYATGISDITTVADPDVAPLAVVTGGTVGYWSAEQFGTAGGEYLVTVNGTDLGWIFDGTDWNPWTDEAINDLAYDALATDFVAGETVTGGTSGASAEILAIVPASSTTGVLKLGTITSGPFTDNETITSASGSALANGVDAAASAITISAAASSALSFVWSYGSRLFFIEKGTLNVRYLPVDAVGGALATFSLAGIFKKGGALMFGATWSSDSGDGLGDRWVVVSTEGEVAVYQGTNPASAADWAKVGVYQIGRPLGVEAKMRAGGELLIGTATGLVPLGEATQKDVAALNLGAASRSIEPYWRKQADSLRTPWQIAKWDAENIMVVSQPGSSVGTCLVANLNTGAWSRFTGLDTQSLAIFGGHGYFGDSDGVIFKMQSGGSDAGAPYTAVYIGQFEGLGLPGQQKTVLQARPTFTATTPIAPQFGMKVDYDDVPSAAPNAVDLSNSEGWDLSVWDVSLWDAAASGGVGAGDSQWLPVGATGYTHAVELQMTFGNTAASGVKYIGADLMLRPGGMVA